MSDPSERPDRPVDPAPESEPAKERADRTELYATLVMALAAVLTAWSAFESAKWSGLQAIAFNEASAARVESTRASATAGQNLTIDVITFTQWLSALNDDVLQDPEARARLVDEGHSPVPGTLSGFLFERFRPEFRPAVDAWLATDPVNEPDAPTTPFVMDEYQLAARQASEDELQRAEQRSADAREANQRSDNYVLTTVAFATVLFFGGISGKLTMVRDRRLALGFAVIVLIGASVVLATFPVEI